MKCQFHLLTHVDDGDLQMYSENLFNIYSHEFKMFFQIFVSKRDTGQFSVEITAYEQYSFINKQSRLWFYFNSKVCFRGIRADLSV